MKIAIAALACLVFIACVPSPEYSGRRLAVDDEEDAGQEEEEQQQTSDAAIADAAIADAGREQTAPDTGLADAGQEQPGEPDASEPDAGEPDAGETGLPDATPSTGNLAFGATCTNDAECATGMCRTFGQLGLVCTQACTIDTECPIGSQGQRCNQQGLCRP